MARYKYIISNSTNLPICKVAEDYLYPYAGSSNDPPRIREYLSDIDIPDEELNFWRLEGDMFIVDVQGRDRFRYKTKTARWLRSDLPNRDWSLLVMVEKKFIVNESGLTEEDWDTLIMLWAKAGQPEV